MKVEYIALAHILIAQNKLDEADRLLQRLIENAKAGDRVIYDDRDATDESIDLQR